MLCTSVKEGQDCFFMSKKGCEYAGGTCHVIIEECEGCRKVSEFPTGKYCITFPDPLVKWRIGSCNMATHVKVEIKKSTQKINPLKASKRAGR